MKKIILVAAMAVFGFTHLNAQDLELGVKGGLNFSTLVGDKINESNIGWTTNFNFGVYAEIPISEKFSLQPELLYSGLGYDTGIGSEGNIGLNYLSIPLLAKYYVTKRLNLEAGPQIGFLLSAKGGTEDYKDLFKTTDFGVNVGVGYKLDNGLNFGVRYNLGLSDINDIDDFSDKYRNSGISIYCGLFIFLNLILLLSVKNYLIDFSFVNPWHIICL